MLEEQGPSDVWNVFRSLNLKRRLGLTASVNRYQSTGKTSNKDSISQLVFSAVWSSKSWYREDWLNRLKQIQTKEPHQKYACRQTVHSIIKGEGGYSDGQYTSSKPRSPLLTFCRAGIKSRKHPSSVSPNFPLRFLSPNQEAFRAISTQGRSYPQHGISRFEA